MKIQTLALALASTFALIGSAKAGDLMDDLATMDLASINESSADVEEIDLDALDMDALEADAGDDTDAIEACFRRFGGFRRGGWNHWGGYRGHGFRSYGHCYNTYSYACHRPLYCYRPIVRCYSHCAPVITSYWGCH